MEQHSGSQIYHQQPISSEYHQQPTNSSDYNPADYHHPTNGGMAIVVNRMDDLLNHNTQQLLQQQHLHYNQSKHHSPAASRKSTKSSGTKSTKSTKYNFSEVENTYEVPHVVPHNLRNVEHKGGYFLAPAYYDTRR